MKKIRWGIIGGGKYVQSKGGKAFNIVENSIVQSVMRRDLTEAKECAQELGAKSYYDNYKKLIDDHEVDAVYIASPPGLHLEQAIYCANAKKPLYLEKPMARNFAECVSIIDVFKENETPLYVSHYRRSHNKFQKLKELIDGKIIGDIFTINCQLNRKYEDDKDHPWYFKPLLSGGGKFIDISPHMIDILIYLFGELDEVKSICVNHNKDHNLEDVVVAIFKFKNNVVGTLNYNMLSSEKNDNIVCVGNKGKLEFSIHKATPIIVSEGGKIVDEIIIENPKNSQEPMIRNVVNDILTGCNNVCYGADALETYRAIDLILDNFYHGRNRNFWEDFNE